MVNRSLKSRFGRLLMAVALGGSAFQVSGCDPAVRDTLLTGLETTTSSLVSTLISAFFTSLQNDSATGSTGDGGLTTT